MDFRLMQQITHGNTKFTGTPKLPPFPIGRNSTPGLIAKSLFQIYTPTYGPKSVNIETKEVKKVDEEIGNQRGSGQSKDKTTGDTLKRKLENDVYQKMMHPTFKISKFEPNIKKEKTLIKKKGSGSTNLTKKETNPEKKYHKF